MLRVSDIVVGVVANTASCWQSAAGWLLTEQAAFVESLSSALGEVTSEVAFSKTRARFDGTGEQSAEIQ